MSERTSIEWTDATWNPIAGCTMVSPGCTNCYAMNIAHRFSWGDGLTRDDGKWNGKLQLRPHRLEEPLRWRRPRKVFVCSGSDLFHEDVPFEFIAAVFGVMAAAPEHTFQVLTKRPSRALEFFEWVEQQERTEGNRPHDVILPATAEHLEGEFWSSVLQRTGLEQGLPECEPWPLHNVWLGVSVEDQKRADERIPLLLKCPAALRWLSCEPLLGEVDILRGCAIESIDWVVVGGESGARARPMNPAWAHWLREQCEMFGVPFLFKQWGTFNEAGQRVGKKRAGRLLDGVLHDAYPQAGDAQTG